MPSIYHMTHLRNLPGILAASGLWCDRRAAADGHCQQGIAHNHIKERRARRVVPISPGGNLADYVPFYFATRQPMLYAIRGGRVEGYTGGQESVVYLRSSTERLAASGVANVFTNGHAEMAFVDFFTDHAQLETTIDWELMKATYWNDTETDPNRKCRRQAEFLAHGFYPWDLTEEVGVYSDTHLAEVQTILAGHTHRPTVSRRREWYF